MSARGSLSHENASRNGKKASLKANAHVQKMTQQFHSLRAEKCFFFPQAKALGVRIRVSEIFVVVISSNFNMNEK